MRVEETKLPGVLLIEPRVFRDDRGHFLEVHHQDRYAEAGIAGPFVQDNFSQSRRNTLRGLHFQKPHAQGKLIHVLQGEIYDVAVDLRRSSPTFGQWEGWLLSAERPQQIYIPPGFAHGFLVMSDQAQVIYKCTDKYYPGTEHTLLWNDPQIGIRWPLEGEPVLSDKDRAGTPFDQLETFEN